MIFLIVNLRIRIQNIKGKIFLNNKSLPLENYSDENNLVVNCQEKVRDRQKVLHCPAGAFGVVPLRKIVKMFVHSQRGLISTTLYKLASQRECTKF